MAQLVFSLHEALHSSVSPILRDWALAVGKLSRQLSSTTEKIKNQPLTALDGGKPSPQHKLSGEPRRAPGGSTLLLEHYS